MVGVFCAAFLTIAATASGAEPGAASESAPIFLGLAVLVLGAKFGGLIAERFGQPSVLGELLCGIVLANLSPLVFGSGGIEFVRSNETLRVVAEVGVLVLLFDVGLETDLRAFAKVGASAALVAVIGVVAPFMLGWAVARWMLPESPALAHVFIGATLTATSVGITVRVLKDLGVTSRAEGQTIIAAAILDDVLGLIILAVVGGSVRAGAASGGGVAVFDVGVIVAKAVGFLGTTMILGHFFSERMISLIAGRGMLLTVGIALCLLGAYIAEFIGLAAIIGAFAAGVFLDPYGSGVRTQAEEVTLRELLLPISELFVPLFFVLMGLQVDLASLADPSTVSLGALLIAAAVVGKLMCSMGVFGNGINRLAVGIGMIPRGEVGLIFAGIGASLAITGQPILGQNVYSAIVMMVLITTLMTPIGLRWAFSN